MEAEAQCAELEILGLVDGIVTDDRCVGRTMGAFNANRGLCTRVVLNVSVVCVCGCARRCGASDVFLFGGRRVYRNIFEDRKFVEAYDMADIERNLGLDRYGCRYSRID